MRTPEQVQFYGRVKYQDFADRLNKACDNNPDVPQLQRGRYIWIQTQLNDRFDIKVSRETSRKWCAGLSFPTNDKLKALAIILKVDSSWLTYGFNAGAAKRWSPEERTLSTSGIRNLVIGLIQIHGGSCSLPDPKGSDSEADILVMIGGRMHKIIVAQAEHGDDSSTMTFKIPAAAYPKTTVIGVDVRSIREVDLYVLPRAGLDASIDRDGPILTARALRKKDIWAIEGEVLRIIEDFSSALSTSH